MICRGVCIHTRYVGELLDSERLIDDLEPLVALMSTPRVFKSASPVGISWVKTPFSLSLAQKRILLRGLDHFVQTVNNQDLVVFSSCKQPRSCSSCSSKMESITLSSLPLITEKSVHTALGMLPTSFGVAYLQCGWIWVNIIFCCISNLQIITLFLVSSWECSNNECNLVNYYDGSHHAVLNMGIFLISHSVVRSYMHHFLRSRYGIHHCVYLKWLLYVC